MRSGLVLGQHLGPILRGERPPRRPRSRINTIRNRWFWGFWIQHQYVRSPPSIQVTHKKRGVSPQPDREGLVEKFPKLKVSVVVDFSQNHDARIDNQVDERIVVADVVHLQTLDDFRRSKKGGSAGAVPPRWLGQGPQPDQGQGRLLSRRGPAIAEQRSRIPYKGWDGGWGWSAGCSFVQAPVSAIIVMERKTPKCSPCSRRCPWSSSFPGVDGSILERRAWLACPVRKLCPPRHHRWRVNRSHDREPLSLGCLGEFGRWALLR